MSEEDALRAHTTGATIRSLVVSSPSSSSSSLSSSSSSPGVPVADVAVGRERERPRGSNQASQQWTQTLPFQSRIRCIERNVGISIKSNIKDYNKANVWRPRRAQGATRQGGGNDYQKSRGGVETDRSVDPLNDFIPEILFR